MTHGQVVCVAFMGRGTLRKHFVEQGLRKNASQGEPLPNVWPEPRQGPLESVVCRLS